MTAPPEASSAEPSRRHWLGVCAAPALVLLAIVLPFLRYHEYSLLLPESLLLIAGAVALGAMIGAVSLLRPATLGPALMALMLCVFALYREEVNGQFIPIAAAVASVTEYVGPVLGLLAAAAVLAVLGACFVLQRHLHTIVTAVFGTFVVSTLVLPTPTGGEPQIAGALPAKLNDLSPIVHVILDEHIGLAALPSDMEDSAAAKRAIRSTYADFALYDRAYSRFGETQYSLASLMNDEPGEDVMSLLRLRGATYVMQGSEWFETLKQKGYVVQVYQSSWLDMCSESDAVGACYTYPLYSINAVQRSPLSTTARLRILLGKLHIGGVDALPTPLTSRETLRRFRADLEERPRGVAYVVHLMLPHYGYLHRADCSLANPSEWENQPGRDNPNEDVTPAERAAGYRLYLEQLECTERLMANLFDELKRLDVYDEATIIVHGDHGSRIAEHNIRAGPNAVTNRDLLDHYSTLLAIKAPGIAPGVREAPTDLQRVFAEMFLGGRAPVPPTNLVWKRDETTNSFTSHMLVWPGLSGGAPGTKVISARRELRPSIE